MKSVKILLALSIIISFFVSTSSACDLEELNNEVYYNGWFCGDGPNRADSCNEACKRLGCTSRDSGYCINLRIYKNYKSKGEKND